MPRTRKNEFNEYRFYDLPPENGLRGNFINRNSAAFGTVGSIVSGANTADPDRQANPLVGALGGGVSGLASGGILGAGIGLLGGLNSAFEHNASIANKEQLERERILANRGNIQFNKKGGVVSPKTKYESKIQSEYLPIQTEVGETMLTDELDLIDVAATKKHKDMDEDEITDLAKVGTYIYSDDKKFSPKKYAEEVLHFEKHEQVDGKKASIKKVTIGDIIGNSKKKISIAEATKRIRNKYKTHRDDRTNTDSVSQITNLENKEARIPILQRLMQIQEGSKKSNSNPKKISHYKDGGEVSERDKTLEELDNLNKKRKSLEFEDIDTLNLFDDRLSLVNEFEDFNSAETVTGFNEINEVSSRLNRNNSLSLVQNSLFNGLQTRTPALPNLINLGDIQNTFNNSVDAQINSASSQAVQMSQSRLANAISSGSPEVVDNAIARLVQNTTAVRNDAAIESIKERAANEKAFRQQALEARISNGDKLENFEQNRIDNVNTGLAEQSKINQQFLDNNSDINNQEIELRRKIRAQDLRNRLAISKDKNSILSNKQLARERFNENKRRSVDLDISIAKERLKSLTVPEVPSLPNPSQGVILNPPISSVPSLPNPSQGVTLEGTPPELFNPITSEEEEEKSYRRKSYRGKSYRRSYRNR